MSSLSTPIEEQSLTETANHTLATKQPCRRVYIETLGCQMNENDSEMMLGLLAKSGFEAVAKPELADLAIINTCQIRDHAESKAFSKMGYWNKLKRKYPDLKIAMAGCVAQQTKDEVFKRAPYVDLVFGTQNIQELPEMVAEVFSGSGQKVMRADRQKDISTYDFFTDVTPIRKSTVSAWVTIIEGCDYFCTYCVVPYTRGRQISRLPNSIVREVQTLAEQGYKEITLLGQTVDAYGRDFDKTLFPKGYTLANLLEILNDIDGIERIRFMTSHPLDLTDDIIDAIARLPKVMEHIHMPMQAGDDTVLERMRRGYTARQYYALIDKIYDRIPGVAVSGDYIVGFPGETEEQFQQTVESLSLGRVHAAISAAYSPRKQTPAAIWEQRGEEVPEDVKERRLKDLNLAIKEQAAQMYAAYLGQTVEVLVEGPSKRNAERLTGRTRDNKVVNFDIPHGAPLDDWVGKLMTVEITETFPFSLNATPLMTTPHITPERTS